MIQQNPYNTAWWGESVGELRDPSFFNLEPAAQKGLLNPFAWVEFRGPLASRPVIQKLSSAGFAMIDVQIPFRVPLSGSQKACLNDGIVCRSAEESPFQVLPEQVQDFEHERFLHIPGMTVDKLNHRYSRWTEQLIREHPSWCLSAVYEGKPQGWFLSQPSSRGLHLALAMRAKGAEVSGLLLFREALRSYAERGMKVGFAAFSVENTPVLNIYSHLGAKFLAAEGSWLWLSERLLAASK
jgi:hypothetical protein